MKYVLQCIIFTILITVFVVVLISYDEMTSKYLRGYSNRIRKSRTQSSRHTKENGKKTISTSTKSIITTEENYPLKLYNISKEKTKFIKNSTSANYGITGFAFQQPNMIRKRRSDNDSIPGLDEIFNQLDKSLDMITGKFDNFGKVDGIMEKVENIFNDNGQTSRTTSRPSGQSTAGTSESTVSESLESTVSENTESTFSEDLDSTVSTHISTEPTEYKDEKGTMTVHESTLAEEDSTLSANPISDKAGEPTTSYTGKETTAESEKNQRCEGNLANCSIRGKLKEVLFDSTEWIYEQ